MAKAIVPKTTAKFDGVPKAAAEPQPIGQAAADAPKPAAVADAPVPKPAARSDPPEPPAMRLEPWHVLVVALALALLSMAFLAVSRKNADLRTASSVLFSLGAGGIGGAFGWGGLDLSRKGAQEAGYGLGIGAGLVVFIITLALFHRRAAAGFLAGIKGGDSPGDKASSRVSDEAPPSGRRSRG